ncbi:hypothetical protein MSAN_01584100 [Mycena sanguinolenta]|uniref:Uncharacterized protein n=1 Tax=Mycena sanguinolenta TaxID=230812 RepID=A0A8H6Y4A4_9AGAR|nr:hypothetical protein MSAN_01584100 [Mycena sanguinolenta]
MPTPEGGFPSIEYSREHLIQRVSRDLHALRDSVDDPNKFYVVVSGGNGAPMRTHGLIGQTISDFINYDKALIQIGTPPVPESGPSPVLWLIAGLPAHLVQTVLTQQVIAMETITLYPIPYNIRIGGFVGTFVGFTLPETQAGADTACNLITSAIRTDATIAQYVQNHRDAFGPQVSAAQAWEIFIHSMHVWSISININGVLATVWQLFVNSPTLDYPAWLQLIHLCGRINVMTALHGTARLQCSYHCCICPSVAHPTGLCPFPSLHGWVGPKPDTIAALEEASRQAATKAQAAIRGASADASTSHPAPGHNQGNANSNKSRKDNKGKKGGDLKGKGKRRDHNDFF